MDNIIFNKVSKSFGDIQVLTNFDFTFKEGEKYYLSGASGKGKTTLLRILTELETIDSGEISGIENFKIIMVFQENRLVENISAVRNIAFVSGKSDSEIMKYLSIFGLDGFEQCPVNQLSGGMKRRVSILRGLLCDFDILILDEPFKGLDEEIKNIVINEVLKLTENKMLIITTHAQEEIEKLNIINKIIL